MSSIKKNSYFKMYFDFSSIGFYFIFMCDIVFRRKALMAQQNFRCAGCGMAVAPGELLLLCLMVVSIINPPVVIWWHSKIIRFQGSVYIYATCHWTSWCLCIPSALVFLYIYLEVKPVFPLQITWSAFGIVTTWGSIFVVLVTATFWKSFQLEWLGNGTSPSILAHMMNNLTVEN